MRYVDIDEINNYIKTISKLQNDIDNLKKENYELKKRFLF